MKNKNILHIITVSFVINHFFGNQFNYLKSKTGNNYFLGCSSSYELFKLSTKLGYEPFPVEITRTISPFKDIKAIFKIFQYIKKNKIDIVVGHTPKGGMVAMIAAYLACVNDRIYYRHGIIYETSLGFKRFILKNIDRLSGSLATKVVCVSHSVKAISEIDCLNDKNKNIILGLGTCNGINTEFKYNPIKFEESEIKKLRSKLNIYSDDFVVGYVGRIVKDKGINELIEAWKLLSLKHNNVKLLLVGPLEEKDPITQNSKQEIENNSTIINTGYVLDSSMFFKLMDVFILPTYREGFPTVTLEASAMELPVITTRATGCEESIIENKTGIFVKNDVYDIVEKIEYYIENRDIKKQHGIAGRKFVTEYFEESKIWDQIHEKLGY